MWRWSLHSRRSLASSWARWRPRSMPSWHWQCSPFSRPGKRAPTSRIVSRRRRDGVTRTLIALLLAAALAAGAQARAPLQVLDDCVARLDSELDVGYAHIA